MEPIEVSRYGYLQMFADEPSENLAVMVGELRSEVKILSASIAALLERVERVENRHDWTDDEIRGIYQSINSVQEQIEEIEQEIESETEHETIEVSTETHDKTEEVNGTFDESNVDKKDRKKKHKSRLMW